MPVSNSLLGSLFPPCVIGYGTTRARLESPPFAEEVELVSKAIGARRREFLLGRECARRAVQHLGLQCGPIGRDEDGVARWPNGLVGSISHTKGYCAAVVARTVMVAGVGLDAQAIEEIEENCLASICTPGEMQWLRSLGWDRRTEAAIIMFSAKEAFFKCQYPLVRRWLDFHDVTVRIDGSGTFNIRVSNNADFPESMCASGRFRLWQGIVLSGVTLLARGL